MMAKPRIIAFYLPQFHPIPENDNWWMRGFTEWTNVGKAKPLFYHHYQPHIPADLGYYDLRVPETRIAQAQLAQEAGIEGFCYWHYWFGNGKRLLERPFNEVLESHEPDFPFCLGWANHSWQMKTWSKEGKNRMLIEQKYLGRTDEYAHFQCVLPAFQDHRYIKVNNKPLFLIWDPDSYPDVNGFIEYWNSMAVAEGFNGIHFVAFSRCSEGNSKYLKQGFDAVTVDLMHQNFYNRTAIRKIVNRLVVSLFHVPRIINYSEYIKYYIDNFKYQNPKEYPCILPNFDHTPRSGKNGHVYVRSTPEKFRKLLRQLFNQLSDRDHENNIIFIKAWNEWGEGNYLEPDIKYGKGYLNAILTELNSDN